MLAHAKRLMALAFVLLTLSGVMACTQSGKTVVGKEEAGAPTTGTQDRVTSGTQDRGPTGTQDRAPSGTQDGAPSSTQDRAPGGAQDRAPGEYVVTVQKGGNEALIRKLFAPFSVKEVQGLGDGVFLLKVEKDPGLEAFKKKGAESDQIRSVQPNFVYRLDRSKSTSQGSIK